MSEDVDKLQKSRLLVQEIEIVAGKIGIYSYDHLAEWASRSSELSSYEDELLRTIVQVGNPARQAAGLRPLSESQARARLKAKSIEGPLNDNASVKFAVEAIARLPEADTLRHVAAMVTSLPGMSAIALVRDDISGISIGLGLLRALWHGNERLHGLMSRGDTTDALESWRRLQDLNPYLALENDILPDPGPSVDDAVYTQTHAMQILVLILHEAGHILRGHGPETLHTSAQEAEADDYAFGSLGYLINAHPGLFERFWKNPTKDALLGAATHAIFRLFSLTMALVPRKYLDSTSYPTPSARFRNFVAALDAGKFVGQADLHLDCFDSWSRGVHWRLSPEQVLRMVFQTNKSKH